LGENAVVGPPQSFSFSYSFSFSHHGEVSRTIACSASRLDTSANFPTLSRRVKKQAIITMDLEGVLVPEIWIAVAEKTGIAELRRTTRDEPDYDKLMRERLALLDRHKLGLTDIQAVIDTLAPLPGAKAFLDELRARAQVILLSDTFEQFARPLMRQLAWPTLLCHRLNVEDDRITGYAIRFPNHKQATVAALKKLNYRVISAGDSFNDTTMLGEADTGYLFHAPPNVRALFPQFTAYDGYAELLAAMKNQLGEEK
jgi:phosphoserine/homoserine phosphotransferase